jgi:hypothetical protein
MAPTPVLREQVTTEVFRVREARWGERYGWISALAWMALGLDSILRPIQDNRREIYWWIPFAFMMLTLVSIHRVQRSQKRRFELYSYWTVMLGLGLGSAGEFGLGVQPERSIGAGVPGRCNRVDGRADCIRHGNLAGERIAVVCGAGSCALGAWIDCRRLAASAYRATS